MVTLAQIIPFAAFAPGMVLTPGPNMIYLNWRSLCQGRRAGYISLCGVALGFMFYMVCAAPEMSAQLMALLLAYAGAAYLLWMAC